MAIDNSRQIRPKKEAEEQCSVFFNFVDGKVRKNKYICSFCFQKKAFRLAISHLTLLCFSILKTLCMLVNLQQEDILSIKKRLLKLASASAASGEYSSFVLATRDLFLVWNGKPLNDECVLADYNMTTKSHATIFCQRRERGGCFAVSFSVLMVIVACILGSTVTCGTSLLLVPLLLPLLVVLPFCCL